VTGHEPAIEGGATAMCECGHHWGVHGQSGLTAPDAVCHGYAGSATPGPLREPCACRGFAQWSGPRDTRTGEPVRPLTLSTAVEPATECGAVPLPPGWVHVDGRAEKPLPRSPADRLSDGEAVPGAEGACARPGCAHSKPWHTPDDPRRPCERCACEAFQDEPGADAYRRKTPGRATTQGLSGSRVAQLPGQARAVTGDLAQPRPPVTLTVHGRPAPQGSKRAVVNRYTGKPAMQESSSRHLKPWREAVKQAGLEAMGWGEFPPLDGPLEGRIVFTVTRSKGDYGTGRNAAMLKPGAPLRPAVAPDLSKTLRAVEDALTDAGVIKDDSRIVEYTRLAKVYAGEDPEALHVTGAVITVRQLT